MVANTWSVATWKSNWLVPPLYEYSCQFCNLENTFCNLENTFSNFDKYIFKVLLKLAGGCIDLRRSYLEVKLGCASRVQIHLFILTNTSFNVKKYIWQNGKFILQFGKYIRKFGQIHFESTWSVVTWKSNWLAPPLGITFLIQSIGATPWLEKSNKSRKQKSQSQCIAYNMSL